MPPKMTTASARIKKAYERLIAKYLAEMDPDIPMGLHAPVDVELTGISEYDGTAGFDPRPDFVRKDDDEWYNS